MIIGITGEIASGKSTVSKILQKCSFEYIDVDAIARKIVEPGKPAYFQVIKNFGKEVLNEDGSLDRGKLGDIVFSDEGKLVMLNHITHKYIFSEVKSLIHQLSDRDIIIDAALLFEIGLDVFTDEIWYVEADKSVRLKRLLGRNLTEKQAVKRMEAQHISGNKSKSDIIIENNREYEFLEKQVLNIIAKNNKCVEYIK